MFQQSYTKYIDESFTCKPTGLSEMNPSTDLHHKQHLNTDISFSSDMVHSTMLRESASILEKPSSVTPHFLNWDSPLQLQAEAHHTDFQRRSTRSAFKVVARSVSLNTVKRYGVSDIWWSMWLITIRKLLFTPKTRSLLCNQPADRRGQMDNFPRSKQEERCYISRLITFDGLNHICCINKLKHLVMKSQLIYWHTSYLSSWSYMVTVNLTFSQATECLNGAHRSQY